MEVYDSQWMDVAVLQLDVANIGFHHEPTDVQLSMLRLPCSREIICGAKLWKGRLAQSWSQLDLKGILKCNKHSEKSMKYFQ